MANTKNYSEKRLKLERLKEIYGVSDAAALAEAISRELGVRCTATDVHNALRPAGDKNISGRVRTLFMDKLAGVSQSDLVSA